MSTPASIIARTRDLIVETRALLETDTVEALPDLAAQLAVEQIFNAGIRALRDAVLAIAGGLDRIDDEFAKLEEFAELITVLSPLIEVLGKVSSDSVEGLGPYGIAELAAVTEGTQAGLDYLVDAGSFSTYTHALSQVVGQLGDPELSSVDDMLEALHALAETIAELDTEVGAEPDEEDQP